MVNGFTTFVDFFTFMVGITFAVFITFMADTVLLVKD